MARRDWSIAPSTQGEASSTDRIVLADGGVYDNLGLEPVIKRCSELLVSDGGGSLQTRQSIRRNWLQQSYRVLSVVDQQVRNLRSRNLVEGYRAGLYGGAYWGIRTPIARYGVEDVLPCLPSATEQLAVTPTRLRRLTPHLTRMLFNWGYAASDAALRAHVVPSAAPPTAFPFPLVGVGEG